MRSWLLREMGFLRGAHLPAMLRGACVRHAAWWLGGLRAVLWQWAGGGLRLPQARTPPTVARRVIHFGPESRCQGSGSVVLRGGVGRRNGQLHCWMGTPPRKIRARFQGYKHTSLTSFVDEADESSRLRGFFAQKTKFVMLS